jgi:hypothetical protein
VRVGVMLLTAAVPLLVTVIVKVTACPIVAGERETVVVLASPPCPMVPTLDAATAMAGTAAPVFESMPVALPVKEIVPTATALYVHWTLADPPAATATDAGVGPVAADTDPVLPAATASEPGVTTAGVPPEFESVRVTVNGGPRGIPDGIDSAPVTAAGACTVTLALAVFDVTARTGLFASNPEADAERVTVPAPAKEQLA